MKGIKQLFLELEKQRQEGQMFTNNADKQRKKPKKNARKQKKKLSSNEGQIR